MAPKNIVAINCGWNSVNEMKLDDDANLECYFRRYCFGEFLKHETKYL